MPAFKKTFLLCAAKLLTLTSAALILSACSALSARAPEQAVCKVTQPEAALMQSRANGALTIGLQRLEAALDQRIEAQSITAGELIGIYANAATRLAELGDESNATALALQDWAQRAVKRCAAP